MSQILRVIKPKIIQLCRFYGGYRNVHSHYETLCIPPDASQKDIRLAFIKLSKKMHPDMSKTANYTDFIKVNEAYRILSKMHTRQQYDMELRYRNAGNGHPMRVVYHEDSRMWNPHRGPMSQDSKDYGDTYYQIKGARRVSNLTIAIVCIMVSAISLSLQVLILSKVVVFRRDAILAENSKLQDTYKRIRAKAVSKDHNEEIAALEQKLKLSDMDTGVKVES